MAEVLLSLGSNINRGQNIRAALKELRLLFGNIDVSPVYESEAVGFDGDNFYNLVVAVHTRMAVGELSQKMKSIEDRHGRERSSPKFSARTLDIDILTYDSLCGVIDGVTLPRDEILKNAFVLLQLADLLPSRCYPGSTDTYQMLWAQFDVKKQNLWKIDFNEELA